MKNFHIKDKIEVGIDEAGRGSLFGRVYSAAVIWNPYIEDCFDNISDKINMIKDSKKLNKEKRNMLRKFIEHYAIDYSVSYIENDEIDKINILNSAIKSMHLSLNKLSITPELILVDGNQFKPYINNDTQKYIEHLCVIKGDSKYISIAAASILAKVYHDEHIDNLCKSNKDLIKYDLLNNMGYGTKKHRDAIKQYGITEYHRKSFKGCF